MKQLLYLTIIFSFLSISCTEQVTNHYSEDPEGGLPPDLSVIHTGYSLLTIHSSHIDTSSYPAYNYVINLNVKFDKPENRNQINKLIIVNSQGFGWEFYAYELETKYSDTLKGYAIENLVYHFRDVILSESFKIKIFSAQNIPAADYEFILNTDFMNPPDSYNNWIDQNKLQIRVAYYNYTKFNSGEIAWLNQNKEEISRTSFTRHSLEDNYFLNVETVPQDAIYLYLSLSEETNNVKHFCLSEIMQIDKRFPSNVQVIEINNYNNLNYKQFKDKIIFFDSYYYNFSVYDFETMDLIHQVGNNNSSYNSVFAYSEANQKIYIAVDGRIYTIGSSNQLVLEANIGTTIYSMIIVDKFLYANTYNSSSWNSYGFSIVNLETGSKTTYNSDTYMESMYNLLYNEKNKIIYGLTSYSTIYRIEIDPEAGVIDTIITKSLSGSSASGMLSPDGSKLLNDNGYIYSCSEDRNNDLSLINRLSMSYNSIKFAPDNNNLLALNSNNYQSQFMDIYTISSLSLVNSIMDFYGRATAFFILGDVIKVISYDNNTNQYYAESYNYSTLLGKRMHKILDNVKLYKMKKL